MFKTTTVNRYLRQWGHDHETLRRQPAAVRFQAEHSNDCWQFDLSPSDLKEIKEPLWLQPNKGAPTLMLFSVVDDRSGVAYHEYRCVYGEDVEAGLRFLFNAMAPKQIDGFLFTMLSDVRNHYGLARDFGQAGYFETEHSEQIVSELKLEIKAGKLVALSGIVGCGKTTMLRRIQEALSQDKEILASKSLSLEKSQISRHFDHGIILRSGYGEGF
jgi:ABC-type glutathione transport system ATPase component